MSRPAEGSTLTLRQLNRAYLKRQHLLERVAIPVREMVTHLVGMQSQVPGDPFTGLWTRIEAFDPAELDALMEDREVVRILTMRGTIHLLTREDAQLIWPLMAKDLIKLTLANKLWKSHYDGLDIAVVQAEGRRLLEASPMPSRQVREHLGMLWPDRDAEALSRLIHFGLPLVQVTPRGLWKRSMATTHTTLDAWLGEPTPETGEADEIVRRYLRAFGPASTADFRTWSRLTGMKETFARLRPELVSYCDERGRELFDVPDGEFVDPETPAPVRFLPGFENALLSHDDRTRVVSERNRRFLASANGMPPAAFLIDGFVSGSWKITRTKSAATLTIRPFEQLSLEDRAQLEAEGERFVRFLEPDAKEYEVGVAVV